MRSQIPIAGYILSLFIQLLVLQEVLGQETATASKVDTVRIEAGKLLVLKDTLYVISQDTILYFTKDTKYKVKKNPYSKSESFYDSLESKAYRNSITKNLYQLAFRSGKTEFSDTLNEVQSVRYFLPFEGKTIRRITFKQVDILEGSVFDTTQMAASGIAKAANSLHIQTTIRVINQNLLFEEGDQLSPTLLADNERLLRKLNIIQDARILVLPVMEDENYVDVHIVSQDRFSILFGLNINSLDAVDIEVGDRNFLGSGKELKFRYRINRDEIPSTGYDIKFFDTNLRGSFFELEIKYSDYWDKQGFEFDLNREFLTPQMKWAGGYSFGNLEQFRNERLLFEDYGIDTTYRFQYSQNYQDFWLGRSFQIGDKESRKNIILSGRMFRQEFTSRPFVALDSNNYFHNETLLLGALTYNRRDFLKSSMILAFGITEDIPTGFLAGLDYGYEFGEFFDRPYIAGRIGAANFLKKVGYFLAQVQFGGYLQNESIHDGVFELTGKYFSPLVKSGRKRFRQFVNAKYSIGLNRAIDRYINTKDEIRGLNILGKQRLSLNLESVVFLPGQYYGFRFAPYLFFDSGWIAQEEALFARDQFYISTGIGFRIRNESLLFKTIQLRFGFFPIQSNNDRSFAFDFSTSDPSLFQNFRGSKPSVIPFR